MSGELGQLAVILLLVLGALIYLGRRIARQWVKKGCDKGCGCGKR